MAIRPGVDTPQLIDDPVRRDDLVGVDDQQREQGPLLVGPDLDRGPVAAGLELPQHPVVQGSPPRIEGSFDATRSARSLHGRQGISPDLDAT